jgi:hypothetical protein
MSIRNRSKEYSVSPIRLIALLAAPLAVFAQSVVPQTQTGSAVVTVGKTSVPASQQLHLLLAMTSADSAGRLVRADSNDDRRPFTLADIPVGRYRLEARALGYRPETAFVTIAAGGTERVSMELSRVEVELAKVETMGYGKGHLADFERRRTSGKGTFLTRDDIAKKGQHSLAEALRGVRGLRVDCASTCKVKMIRSTNCEPSYFINGFPSDYQALNTPILDVAGVEIYRGPSETPGEFIGSNAMCGAIVIWTK